MHLSRPLFRCCSIVLLISLLLQTTACSFFASKTQTLNVISEPSGAQVQINGSMVGVTPLQYELSRYSDASLLITKKGYEPQQRYLSKSISTVGIVDIIGGVLIIIPIIGLLAPGAWELERNNISVVLPEASQR
jgi:hypothetical protein